MQDGIIKGTGNSRYLKSAITSATTWEQFRQMLIAGNAPIDLNGINQGGWNQLPTWLNKANLLTDETAAEVWDGEQAPEDPTVNQALQQTAENVRNVFKVGDTLSTIRTDLGNSWLLCNGETLSQEQEKIYPDLLELIPRSGSKYNAYSVPYTGSTSTINISSILKDEQTGKYVALALVSGSAYYGQGLVISAEKPTGPWTVEYDLSGLAARCYWMQYVNGYYFVGMSGSTTTSTNGAQLAYFAKIGDTIKTINLSSYISDSYSKYRAPIRVRYENNQWLVIIGGSGVGVLSVSAEDYRYYCLLYASSLTGSWTHLYLTGSAREVYNDILYRNGYYYLQTWYTNPLIGSGSAWISNVIVYATSLSDLVSGSRLKYGDDISSSSSLSGFNGARMFAHGNYIYVTSNGGIYRIDPVAGSPTITQITETSYTNSLTNVVDAGDAVLIRSGSTVRRYYYSDLETATPDATATGMTYNVGSSQFGVAEIADGQYFGGGAGTAGAFSFTYFPAVAVPTVSIDGLYTYIRAKED